jgi:long-chain acyl-CoA synthetase
MSSNRLEFIETVLAVGLAGGAVVPVNPRYTSDEAGYVCVDGDAKLLFADEASAAVVGAASLASLERTIVFESEYEQLLARTTPVETFPRVQEWEPFALVYTSGTTGRPKGVVLSHRARTLTFLAMAAEYGCYSSDDRSAAVAPLYHGGGLSFAVAPLFLGGSCVILPHFDPELLLETISSLKISNAFLVPTHFHKIFALDSRELEKRDLRSLKGLISNGAPLPQATKEQIVDYFGPNILHETYGSTEASTVTNLRPEDQLRKQGSVGLPFPATEVRILDESGDDVDIGEHGELYSRSPYLFSEYWRQPDATARAFRGEWCSSGDLARRDDEGYLYIVGRTDDMIISGGVNIYPREVEEVLLSHPGVSDVAVVGLPDTYWGEAVTAFVVHRGSAPVSDDDLSSFCASRLARFKLPKRYEFVEALPRTDAGKILRRELRRLYAEADTALTGMSD